MKILARRCKSNCQGANASRCKWSVLSRCGHQTSKRAKTSIPVPHGPLIRLFCIVDLAVPMQKPWTRLHEYDSPLIPRELLAKEHHEILVRSNCTRSMLFAPFPECKCTSMSYKHSTQAIRVRVCLPQICGVVSLDCVTVWRMTSECMSAYVGLNKLL